MISVVNNSHKGCRLICSRLPFVIIPPADVDDDDDDDDDEIAYFTVRWKTRKLVGVRLTFYSTYIYFCFASYCQSSLNRTQPDFATCLKLSQIWKYVLKDLVDNRNNVIET